MALTLRDKAIAGFAFEAGKSGDVIETMKAKLAIAERNGMFDEAFLRTMFDADGQQKG